MPVSDSKVVSLVPRGDIDAQKIAAMIGKLAHHCEQGRVHAFMYAYVNEAGAHIYGISGNMSVKNLSMAIHYLEAELHDAIRMQLQEVVK